MDLMIWMLMLGPAIFGVMCLVVERHRAQRIRGQKPCVSR